jgi:hypothetical protein
MKRLSSGRRTWKVSWMLSLTQQNLQSSGSSRVISPPAKREFGGGRCNWVTIIALEEIVNAFHPKEEWWPPILAFWWGWNTMSDALGNWKGRSSRDGEQNRQVDECREAIAGGTREAQLGVGVGGCSIGLVDCVGCDGINDFKTTGARMGATKTNKQLKGFGGLSIFPSTLPLILSDNRPTISASQACPSGGMTLVWEWRSPNLLSLET